MAFRKTVIFLALKAFILTIALSFVQVAFAETTLRAVMYSSLKIVDPIWTTSAMSKYYGYMVYDTLFAMDENHDVKPQMVENYSVSDDKLTYTFTLRDGLLFHDGNPVTTKDVIASLKRWGKRDSLGQKLIQFTREFKVVNDQSFQLILKEPFGLVLTALGKPGSNVPFIMPKHIAETPADKQISEFTGSGPFIFKADEWEPGVKAVFAKNPNYKPRNEPPSWLAGGKVVKVGRVEWLTMSDHQTAMSALIAGEIDYMQSPPYDLLPLLEQESDKIAVAVTDPIGGQFMFRLNHLQPPFDNVKIRRAALAAINQKDFLEAAIGNPAYYKTCPAMYICGTPFASDTATEIVMKSDFELAKKLLKEGGYDGTPVVILHSTTISLLKNLAPVAAQALKKAGFNVELQTMDWRTLVGRRAKKGPPSEGGWNLFMTAFGAADLLNPVLAVGFNAGCDKAYFGWPCDDKMEGLRDTFIRETDPDKHMKIAEQIQVRAMEIVTHGHAGQYFVPAAWRKDRLDGVLMGPNQTFWNISKR